jgi:ERCC4-type nuclease
VTDASAPRLLIAPTEPPQLKTLGKVSSTPERWGCDVLGWVGGRKVGVQRKRWDDLMASVADGRLAKEVQQMGRGVEGLLVVEGQVKWGPDGHMVSGFKGTGRDWTRQGWEALLWSVQDAGVKVVAARDLDETVERVRWWYAWASKPHTVLRTRGGKPASVWGTPRDREWGAWLLQGFEGIGVELATRIVDRFGGVPLRWTVTREELLTVEGLGKKKVDRLMKMMGEHDDGR